MKLTQVTLLSRMQIGRDYNPTYLAQHFDVTTAILRDTLCALAQEGFVKMINKTDGKIAFRRVKMSCLYKATIPLNKSGVPQFFRLRVV
jgi:hypothetical protein